MAELGLAVVSLTFQVFAGCIKGYQLLSEASDLPREYEYMRVRLKTEQFRLLDWAHIVKISEDDDNLSAGTAERGVFLEVLQQQQKLLFRFAQYGERLEPLATPTAPEPKLQASSADATSHHVRFPQSKDLLQKALLYIHTTRNLPGRLRWVVHDKAKIDTLLGKLADLNNFLTEFLNKNQVGKFLELQARTNYGIMQLNSNVGQLLNIFQATRSQMSPESARTRRIDDHATTRPTGLNVGERPKTAPVPYDDLASLAKIKALNLAIEESNLTDPLAKRFRAKNSQRNYISRVERDKHVWIEWRRFPGDENGWPHLHQYRTGCNQQGATNTTLDSDGRMNARPTALVAMLRPRDNAELFHASPCLGYFCSYTPAVAMSRAVIEVDERELCSGLVFEKPHGCDPSVRLASLLKLLRRRSPLVPSLTQRVKLALAVVESVERLHAVNWLHKGLRSYNILFFAGDNRTSKRDAHDHKFDLTQPIVSGFDYSRPTKKQQWTEKAKKIQPTICTAAQSFKKTYDYYSLGVILFEIARWQSIDTILNVDLESAQIKHTITVRRRLLHEELRSVRGCMDDVMHDVIETCLTGPTAFGLDDTNDEVDPEVAAQLQREFYFRVVEKIKGICV
ncbi:uncharacterized protein F4822DRAFT_441910 [Hypoxylon trugodes]|uniref:uncharacterized protein n=1 Tax=Hypoxylon trugodes TaxID=326681 RepID=UPI0021922F7B|nr:uncharacterized protein F4822DRAFT_441910 [Hypoxylon trugodes]KAI1390557.1 hypothetical protein F4822DRAFT_441910 [Hypoxylon trugodes]